MHHLRTLPLELKTLVRFFKKKISKTEILKAYYETFGGDAGQIVLHDLIKMGHVLGTTFVPGDPMATAFREGQRAIVLAILTAIETRPEDVQTTVRSVRSYDIQSDTEDINYD